MDVDVLTEIEIARPCAQVAAYAADPSPLTAPASNYYRNMTQQTAVMPVLVGQVI